MEASPPPILAKRLWNIVRIVFFMLRKGISKRKLMVDLHLMMERGKIAGKKAFGNLIFHHHPNFSCRTTDVHVSRFVPGEYEFSCSNSPAFPFHLSSRRKNHHYQNRHNHNNHHYFSCIHSPEEDISTLHKALEMLNSDMSVASSPVSVLPGFGNSPMVRQLRITDSPFPLKDGADENCVVDMEAEEFIEKFYEQLRLQKRMAALEARYQEMMMAG